MKRARNARPKGQKRSLGSVTEIMSTRIVTAEPQEAASIAWSRMQRRNVGHLVVMENHRISGIVSEGALGR